MTVDQFFSEVRAWRPHAPASPVSVIVAYFGDRDVWEPLAGRAVESARSQTVPCEVLEVYGRRLDEARNHGAYLSSGRWLIFLDADDELDSRYVEKMLEGTGDVRQPATLGVVDGNEDPFPVVIPAKPLLTGNYIVVGAMVERDMFFRVGAFRDLPAYEDWDLWLRCWLDDARITVCEQAVYRVHVRPDGRNNLPRAEQVALFDSISVFYKERAKVVGKG